MMTLDNNKQKMFYSLQIGEAPIYETDEEGNIIYYQDSEGNQIPIETGDTGLLYSKPVSFCANISMSDGEAKNKPYGKDYGDYDAIISMNKNEIPINETSLIWFENNPVYKDKEKNIIDLSSADYKVLGVIPSINQVRYILERLTK